MNQSQLYYEACKQSEYYEAFDKATTIWRKHLWNTTETRNKILACVKANEKTLMFGNPYVHDFEYSSMLDRLRSFKYSTEPTRIDDESKEMLCKAMREYADALEQNYRDRYLVGTPNLHFSLRHPFKSFKDFGKLIKPDYYILTMNISDAHVNMKERIWNVPNSQYKDAYEGIADCDFTIDIFSDLESHAIANLEFPYQDVWLSGKEHFHDNSDLALYLTTQKYERYEHKKMLLYADSVCTPINIWVASLSDSVLPMEDELLRNLEEYVNTEHIERTERGNEINAWSEKILAGKEIK